MRLPIRPPTSASGFTLVELVVTMIVIGIMAIVAIPRLGGIGAFDARGYADQTEAILRFAQKSALAQRRNVLVVLSTTVNTEPNLCIATTEGGACPGSCGTSTLIYPARPGTARSTIGIGFAAGSGSFCFDTLGGTGSQQIIEFRDENSALVRTITIEAVTGYVHAS